MKHIFAKSIFTNWAAKRRTHMPKKNRRVYLDHAATTPIDERVLLEMVKHSKETYGNPSSIHHEGVVAKKVLTESRMTIAGIIGCHADEIIFTASATESCNLAIIGAVRAWKESHPDGTPHIIASAIEHDAVLGAVRYLEREGVRSTIVPVDAMGIVDVSAIESAITKDTVCISVGYANNEIGTVQPIANIAHMIRRWKKDMRGVTRDVPPTTEDLYPLLHTDASQATNYLPLNIQKIGVDMLTINAAKIYGPKGIALLARKRGIPLDPIIIGGGQEGGVRAGTENVPLIVGFTLALLITKEMEHEEVVRLTTIRDYALSKLSMLPGVIINGSTTMRLPNNINFSIGNADHEFLALALDAHGFAVSTKSACNEEDAEVSHVLQALKATGHDGYLSGIRVTLGRGTSMQDIDEFLHALSDIQKQLLSQTLS